MIEQMFYLGKPPDAFAILAAAAFEQPISLGM
jgi:hypothetical protein